MIRFRSPRPSLSVVVVAYDMARELPRTLRSLAPGYQRGIARRRLRGDRRRQRVARPVDAALLDAFRGQLRSARIDPAPPTPARAANLGHRAGRRRLRRPADRRRAAREPGAARPRAARAPRSRRGPIVATLGWHLGPTRHMDARDGRLRPGRRGRAPRRARLGARRLPAVLDQHARGVVGTRMVRADGREQRAVHGRSRCGSELGGLDERFVLPGGGLSNHDLYRRACELDGVAARRAARRGNVPPDPRRRGDVGPHRLGRDARRVRDAARAAVRAADERAALPRHRPRRRRCRTSEQSAQRRGASSCAGTPTASA